MPTTPTPVTAVDLLALGGELRALRQQVAAAETQQAETRKAAIARRCKELVPLLKYLEPLPRTRLRWFAKLWFRRCPVYVLHGRPYEGGYLLVIDAKGGLWELKEHDNRRLRGRVYTTSPWCAGEPGLDHFSAHQVLGILENAEALLADRMRSELTELRTRLQRAGGA